MAMLLERTVEFAGLDTEWYTKYGHGFSDIMWLWIDGTLMTKNREGRCHDVFDGYVFNEYWSGAYDVSKRILTVHSSWGKSHVQTPKAIVTTLFRKFPAAIELIRFD